MLSYQRVDANAIPLLKAHFAAQPYRSCDYTAGVTYMWRDYFQTEYAIRDGMLYLRMRAQDGVCYHMIPAGAGDPIKALKLIAPTDGVIRLSAVPEEVLPALQTAYGEGNTVTLDRKWADYLYDRESLATYRGKKLAGQRNHVNKFMSLYSGYEFVPLTAASLPACRDFLLDNQDLLLKPDPAAQKEFSYALDMLDHALTLSAAGGLLRLPDGEAVGVCLGTVVGDTFYEHIEKALHTVPGASQLLCRECAAHAPEGVKFINREDDMGDEGLRTAKLRLHPVRLVNKYTVTIPL